MPNELKVINKLTSDLTVNDLAEICEKEGVTVQSVCRALAEGLKSNIMRTHNSGVEDSGEPDNALRHKYMTSAMEVLKLVKKEVTTTNNVVVNTINYSDVKMQRITEALELEEKLKTAIAQDHSHKGKVIDIEESRVVG